MLLFVIACYPRLTVNMFMYFCSNLRTHHLFERLSSCNVNNYNWLTAQNEVVT